MMMGLFDNLVAGAIEGMLGRADSRSLPSILSQVMAKTDFGSLGGLLAQLQQGGLDRQVASWLGNGANMPLSADQLRSALGDAQLGQLAGRSGLSLDALLGLLVQNLPDVIDRMSPNGHLDETAAPANETPGSGGSLAGQAGLDDIRS
jgi:uncharacterized protein YidB (DUF937 family)